MSNSKAIRKTPSAGRAREHSCALPFVLVKQKHRQLYLTKMAAGMLTEISYVAVWKVDEEEGAVQRPLSPRRIESLKEFALAGGDYPACIILNWRETLSVEDNKLCFAIAPRLAQIIDGQHRVEGLREAIEIDDALRELELPVAIYEGLNTNECADIFVSINTEQRPAPKSLVYDLFGIVSSHIADVAVVRAGDIARYLHDDEDSPFRGLIKFPGAPKVRFGLQLSTVVTALKPFVDDRGLFESAGVRGLEHMQRVLVNYFIVLRKWYGNKWLEKDNVFMHAAGFTGAMNFFQSKLMPYCHLKRSYSISTMQSAMKELKSHDLLLRSSLKNLQGRASSRAVSDFLESRFNPLDDGVGNIEY
jgi:DNA sulfur modification protein DndB